MIPTTLFKLALAVLDLYARAVYQTPPPAAEIKTPPPIVQDKLAGKNAAMNAELGPWSFENITVFVNESFEAAATPRDYFAYNYIVVADVAVAGNETLRPAYNAQFHAF